MKYQLKQLKLVDEKNKEITGIKVISQYNGGFIVLTDTALYSNVEIKSYDENNESRNPKKNTVPRGKVFKSNSSNTEKVV